MENKKIKVALLGLGTVGSGVYKLLQKRAESMVHIVGTGLEVEKILVHNRNKKRERCGCESLDNRLERDCNRFRDPDRDRSDGWY